jgi:hypothetical protein
LASIAYFYFKCESAFVAERLGRSSHIPTAARRHGELVLVRWRRISEIALRLVTLDLASKYDRSREHIETLLACGRKKAEKFFGERSFWRARGQGLHQATLGGAGKPREHRFVQMPDIASTASCTTPCIYNGLCETFPQMGPAHQLMVKIGQTCF